METEKTEQQSLKKLLKTPVPVQILPPDAGLSSVWSTGTGTRALEGQLGERRRRTETAPDLGQDMEGPGHDLVRTGAGDFSGCCPQSQLGMLFKSEKSCP